MTDEHHVTDVADAAPPNDDASPASERTKPAKRRRSALSILYSIAVIYVVWLIVALLIQRTILFPTHMIPEIEGLPPIAGVEDVSLDTDAGKVEGWFVPGRYVSDTNPGPVVILAHGNGELIDFQHETVEDYRERGISVMLGEYRGYGRSAGSPSQKAITDDYIAWYDMLTERADVDASRIVFHGRSIGSGVVASLARHREPAAIVLRSPMYSIRSMMLRYGVLGPFVRDPFDSAAALRDYDGPVLIMHGTHDNVVPFSQGKALHEALPGSTMIEFNAGHNDFPEHRDEHWDAIEQTLREAKVIE